MTVGKVGKMFAYDSKDGTYNPLRMDSSSSSIQVIDYEHHEVHGGSTFHAYRGDTLATDDNIWIAITTPNTDKEAHIVWSLYCSGAVTFTITKNFTSYTGGTSQIPQNANQRSISMASDCIVKVGSYGVLADGLSVTGGVEYDKLSIGSGNKSGGSGTHSNEFIPAKNSITVFDILAVGNAIVCDLRIDWYEHTPHAAP